MKHRKSSLLPFYRSHARSCVETIKKLLLNKERTMQVQQALEVDLLTKNQAEKESKKPTQHPRRTGGPDADAHWERVRVTS